LLKKRPPDCKAHSKTLSRSRCSTSCDVCNTHPRSHVLNTCILSIVLCHIARQLQHARAYIIRYLSLSLSLSKSWLPTTRGHVTN
jgi:hypothetical protein